MRTISRQEARQIILSAQGLAHPNPFGPGLAGTKKAIEHLGYVQIDSIAVVERAHNHILWSRVKDFHPNLLAQLLESKQIFEYWSHAASYLPMRDFRFSLPRKKLFATGERKWFASTAENSRLKRKILARIRAEGPLTARDFLAPTGIRRSGWWDWKPAKRALEQLFMEGHLMVASRKKFEKLYDLTERVLPSEVNSTFPTPTEHARHLALRSIAAHGLICADEITYLRSSFRSEVDKECVRMVQENTLEELRVEGVERHYLTLPGVWEKALLASGARDLHVLSPFDNQVIQRKRLKELFGFDYTIECYVPEPKRQFGYFCLPILQGNRFMGRMDAKAERSRKVLTVRAFHVERGCGRKSDLWREAQGALAEFARFNGCDAVEREFR